MSVNFGNLQNKENRKLIKQEFQIEDVEQGFLMKNKKLGYMYQPKNRINAI